MFSRATTNRLSRQVVRRRVLWCATIAALLGPYPALSFAAAAASGADASANGGYADFDRNLLSGAGQNTTTDLSRFEHGNPVLAGTYNTDVKLNGAWIARTDVRFVAPSPNDNAAPCITAELFRQTGLRAASPSEELQARLKDPAACVAIGDLIPGATTSFDMGELRLDISVPQAYVGRTPRGYVDPQYWDTGVPAARLNYNFNSYRSTSQGQSQTSSYLGLNAGVNIGAWHFRHDSTLNWLSATAATSSQRHWQNIDTYVQRDLPSLRAQLTVGDSFTDGSVFDSFGVRGVQLATDDRMLPESVRGYAPVVRGVADTNALITVRQNGAQIYQTTVAPGPFVIKDIYPTGYGGNLDVTVTEADGRVRTFSVPYASVAQLLRPGTLRFGMAAGQLRNQTLQHRPNVVQATAQYGFSNLITGYAGLQGAQDYASILAGAAVNTPLGAFAADVTHARTEIPGYATQSGQSVRLSYSKILPQSGTSLSVAAYRYSTSGFLSLSDAAVVRDYALRGLNAFTEYSTSTPTLVNGVPLQTVLTPGQQATLAGTTYNPSLAVVGLQRQRNRFSLTLNQQLGEHGGTLYANGSVSDYWNRNGTDTQFQVGYNGAVRSVSYTLSATRTRDPLGRYDNEYGLTVQIPLGESVHAPSLNLTFNHNAISGNQEQAMLAGSAGSEDQYNYTAMASHNENGGTAGSVSGGYRAPFATFNASVGKGSGYSQTSVGMSGGVVVHAGGITFGQPLGDTVGVIYAPGADGARVSSSIGAHVNASGYALVPYLSPYLLNTIELDPKGLPLDVQLDATSAQVAPHAGAVVMLKFKTKTGRTLVANIHQPDGTPVPFGTEVLDEKGTSLGMVGQGGQALIRVAANAGELTARWQDDGGMSQACSFTYQLAAPDKNQALAKYAAIDAVCTAPRAVAQTMRNHP
ncbi:fimbria/pilus outer membrane usher protein [Dyella silvae]|uniref:fimbria/pilus outer membrane usher protein n=1 Tax=Dyella silvae TaxID=2994424 RepID=UPI0022647AD5|nr:fimbria/pilus outer membrane usher protein [Dyella silvae]